MGDPIKLAAEIENNNVILCEPGAYPDEAPVLSDADARLIAAALRLAEATSSYLRLRRRMMGCDIETSERRMREEFAAYEAMERSEAAYRAARGGEMSVINVRQELALAQVEIARLRAEVERLTRDRDLAERKAAVCREDVEINARRAESAEAEVAELEAEAQAYFAALDRCLDAGVDITREEEAERDTAAKRLRALLAPREPKPCGTCGGSGSVWDGPAGVHVSDGNAMKPCPNCRGGGEK